MNMDVNDLRITVTVVSLLLFVVLVLRTWSRRRLSEYAQAAQLPFEGEEHVNANRGELRE
jgi:cytochrome c oxidase cbb3-type subunit 4